MPAQKRTNNNARMVHRYLEMMRHSRGRSETTLDQVAASLADFERVTASKDFRNYKPVWAIQFKEELASRRSDRTGHKLSTATVVARLQHIKGFFEWLSDQEGYRSRIRLSDVSYFTPSLHDSRAALSRPRRQIPTLEQIRHLIHSMPMHTELDMRNQALVAFILLTGARADAAASFPLGHLDVMTRTAFFDGRATRTKNRKGYTADLFPVGDDIEGCVIGWARYLREKKLLANSDPLFPATLIVKGKERLFTAEGLGRQFWKSSEPVRRIFKQACDYAGLPYINPHSFRTTLGLLGQRVCKTPEEMKVWSQNLGHESVDTTFRNYGFVIPERQAELMAMMRNRHRE